jgi:phosphatidylserine/phosphatidylglycerophosphate/cardiolipin synthase-like enzyme
MKKIIILVAIIVISIVSIAEMKNFSSTSCSEGTITPVFSPDDSDKILNLIKNAKNEIKLEVYEFSYKELADDLIDSRNRGVAVEVILDPSVYQNNEIFSYLLNSGVDVAWSPKKFHTTHSKFAIIDDTMVLVGSTNWSKNAMKNNREASVIIYSPDVAKAFERIFDSDFQ